MSKTSEVNIIRQILQYPSLRPKKYIKRTQKYKTKSRVQLYTQKLTNHSTCQHLRNTHPQYGVWTGSNPLDAKGNYSATSNNTVVGTRAAAPPSPLLAVSTVTAHLSMASVAITVLLYHGPLLCGDDRRVQSSAEILPLKGWGSWGVGVAHSFNRPRMAHLLIIINYNRRQLPN